MAVLAIVSAIGLFVDDREVTGAPVWAKPLKFALSTAIYSVTLAWLIGQITRFARVARLVGTLSAILLAVELAIITAFAVAGESSHFNVSTPLHVAAWGVMAVSISTLWGLTFVIAAMLFRSRLGDAARTWAIRAGVVIALAGMGLAFLMTGPQGDQISDYQGIVGAHTVGVDDGGPGLPILGWSTVAGDLRIPHFVGMHALQVLPLLAIGLELAARRIPTLVGVGLRRAIVVVAAVEYVAILGILTLQALAGESIVRPSAPTVTATLVVLAGMAIALGVAVVRRSRVDREA
jgi:hypothetical protein